MIASLRPRSASTPADAAKRLVEGDRLFHVAIVGGGPLRDTCGAREILGVSGVVSFLGFREDAREFWAFDVAVAVGLIAKARRCRCRVNGAGRAIVATSVGGIPDVVRARKRGVVVPPGDAASFAVRSRAARCAGGTRTVGSAAAARQRKEYDIVATRGGWRTCYLNCSARVADAQAAAAGRRRSTSGARVRTGEPSSTSRLVSVGPGEGFLARGCAHLAGGASVRVFPMCPGRTRARVRGQLEPHTELSGAWRMVAATVRGLATPKGMLEGALVASSADGPRPGDATLQFPRAAALVD